MWLVRCLRTHWIVWDIIGQPIGRYRTSSDAYWVVLDRIGHHLTPSDTTG
jgi:hypothetical protein